MARSPQKAPSTGKAVKKQSSSKLSFHKQLVLNRFMFRFFKDGTLQGLKLRLGEDRFEGIHEDGQSLFFHELSNYLFEVDLIDLQGFWNQLFIIKKLRLLSICSVVVEQLHMR